MSALNSQIDGNHYKETAIQPIELAYLIGATPCFTKLAKYASRKKFDQRTDLQKAIHCIEIEEELSSKFPASVRSLYPTFLSSRDIENAKMYIEIFVNSCKFNNPRSYENFKLSLNSMYTRDYKKAKIAIDGIILNECQI